MMKKIYILLLTFSISVISYSQDNNFEAFSIFTNTGKKVSVKKMLKELEKADIILFGEYHNNPISHWLEFEVTEYLSDKHSITVGAEMFESDNQEFLSEYLNDEIDKEAFDTLVRLWPNFKTDYEPLLKIAKHKKINFIATNIPRRYAAMVNKYGFEVLDSLPENEKSYIAPLPIDFDPYLSCYKNMIGMMPGHTSENLPKAQAIKDATMAYFILKNFENDNIFIHFNGAYHSDNYQGILWYLKRNNPNLSYITISTVSQSDVNKLDDENKNIADFIICVDNDMTTTY